MATSKATEENKEEAKSAKKTKRQRVGGNYYLINPAGACHGVTKEHAAQRLKLPGWRLATEEEIDIHLTPQPAGKPHRGQGPIAPRWSSDPDAMLDTLEGED